MIFTIVEGVPYAAPLCEEYDPEDMSDYASHLSVVTVYGVIGNVTEIGSGVCIATHGDIQQGQAGLDDMKEQSKVFRKALNLAIERGDVNSGYFRAILDDYEKNGIRMPFHEPFWED